MSNDFFAQCNFTVNAGPDIKVCNAGDMTLMAGKVTGIVREIYWEPPTGLQDPKNPNSKITINANGEYILVAKGNSGVNLVNNGDFEQGNTGFFTDYILGFMSCYGAGYLDCEGTYAVINNPQLGHTGFAACKDHTSGGGNMMVLNGAASFQNVWCQTVPVMPNMDYIFTAWITSVVASSPPILQFNINGSSIGPTFNSSGAPCNWEKYEVIWNSGSNASADICILNENTSPGGNDFAIDDISFVKICEKRDTVLVEIEELNIVIEDPGIVNCDRPQLQIDATGSTQGKNFTYKWTTSNGKIISGDKTLKPTIEGPGTYELTICSPLPNCCKKAFIEILGNIKPPDLTLTVTDSIGCINDSIIIYLQSSVNPLDYFWKGPNGFESDEQNPIVKFGGTYTVTIIDEYNCKTTKSITVFENADNPKITIKSNNINCIKDTAFLKGNSTVAGSIIEWYGPNGFYLKGDSLQTIDSGVYKIKVTTPNSCIRFDSVRIIKDKNFPLLNYSSDTINCVRDSSQIIIKSSIKLNSVEWKSNNNFTQLSDSSIKTNSSGLYKFIGTANNGCKDSVFINILADTVKPNLNPVVDTINCMRTNVSLNSGNNNPNKIIEWSGPNGFISNVDGSSIDIPGIYKVKIIASNSCSSEANVNIMIDTIHPNLSTKNDTLNCLRDKLNLFLTDSYNSIYEWTGPTGFKSTQKNPQIDTPGIYVIKATLPNGCETAVSVVIFELKNKPIISYKNDTLNCLRDSLNLQANTDDPQSIFTWEGPGGFTSNVINPNIKSAGNYKFIVTNSLGCMDSATILISQDVRKPDLLAFNDTINCKKTSVSLKAISNRDSLSYTWTGPNGFSSNDSIISTNFPGQYKILVVSPEFCKSELVVSVDIDTLRPSFNLSVDSLNCKVTQTKINNSIQSTSTINWLGPNGFNSIQAEPIVNTPGLYSVTISGSNFCTEMNSILVIQDTIKPIVQLNSDTLTCIKKLVDLIALVSPNQLSGRWTYPDNSNIIGNIQKISKSGIYKFNVVGSNYCPQSAAIFILADTIQPDVNATGDFINCKKTSATILANSNTSNITYSWTGPNAYSSSQSSNNIIVAGTYKIKVTARNGCTNEQTINVSIDTIKPTINLVSDTINCNKAFAIVQSSTDVNNPIIVWKNNMQDSIANSKTITTDKAGTFTIEITNPTNFCKSISRINVVEDSLRIKDLFITTKNPICGNQFGKITNVGIVGGNGNFTYSIGRKDSIISNLSNANFVPGLYTLFVKDNKNCEFSKDFIIVDIPFIQTDITPEIKLQLGQSSLLDLNITSDRNIIRTIDWQPATYLSCNDCEDPIASPPMDIEYTVTVTDTNGCKSIQRIKVNVEDPQVWLPNVFSPNDDGINDWFYPFSSKADVITINTFQIFDRWGELVYANSNFRPDELDKGWNGNYKDQHCNPGVYVYWLEAELINGKKFLLKGDVTLVK